LLLAEGVIGADVATAAAVALAWATVVTVVANVVSAVVLLAAAVLLVEAFTGETVVVGTELTVMVKEVDPWLL
jgi:hypothetical protein